MSKIIKVEVHVYNELAPLRDRGETFSQVVEELLIARRRLLELMNTLEGCLKVNKWREGRLRQIQEPENAAAVAYTAKKKIESGG